MADKSVITPAEIVKIKEAVILQHKIEFPNESQTPFINLVNSASKTDADDLHNKITLSFVQNSKISKGEQNILNVEHAWRETYKGMDLAPPAPTPDWTFALNTLGTQVVAKSKTGQIVDIPVPHGNIGASQVNDGFRVTIITGNKLWVSDGDGHNLATFNAPASVPITSVINPDTSTTYTFPDGTTGTTKPAGAVYNAQKDKWLLPNEDEDGDGIINSQDQRPIDSTANLAKYGLDQDGNPLPTSPGTHTTTTHTPTTPTHTGGGAAPAPSLPSAPIYHLIEGNGPNTGDVINLKGNGAAVYAVNDRGERFHVTENLYNQMVANGTWSQPEIQDQATVDSMPMRYNLNVVSDLSSINTTPTSGGFMLVKGDGGPLDNNTLVGNGNAVYAVDIKGNKFHVTEGAYNDIIASNGGVAPPIANISQSAVDISTINGALADSGGTPTLTTDPVMDQALASAQVIVNGSPAPQTPTPLPTAPVVTPGVPDPTPIASIPGPATATAPATPADEALGVQMSSENTSTDFRLVRGSDGDMTKSDTDLVGNGRAVYAVNAQGQKFHVTGELYNAMVADGTWKEPELIPQASVDAMQNGSSVSLTNMDQLRTINIGLSSEYRLIKGDAANTGDVVNLTGNGAAIYVLTANGDRYHVTEELANKMQADGVAVYASTETLKQGEVDTLGTLKGNLTTVKELNEAVKNPSALGAGGYVTDSAMPAVPPGQVAFTNNN